MKQTSILRKLRYPMTILSLAAAVFANPVMAFAEGGADFSGAATPVVSLINSLLGPISLTVHWVNYNETSHFGGYFSFGYAF